MNIQGMSFISPIEEIIEEARNGRMFILVDDENRENEGDIVIPAQMATPDVINFMVTHARGLVCLTLSKKRIEELQLSLMTQHNMARYQTAFTVSIEAMEGVTTGISAPDRAKTIAVAIDPSKGAADICTPGHIFPLAAHNGGVLVRAGHTEAAVDIARLAGLNPSGVICEIMKDDGTMARMPDLVEFSKKHNLKIGKIADLIAHRLHIEPLVERVAETEIDSEHGGKFKALVYKHKFKDVEYIALIKGDIQPDEATLVHVHPLNIFADVLGDKEFRTSDLKDVMEILEREGKGIIVLIRRYKETMSSIIDAKNGANSKEENAKKETLREYGIGAQILKDAGVRDMVILSDSNPYLVALEGYGLSLKGHRKVHEG